MRDEGQFQKVAELFEQARDLPPDRREGFLRDACGGNTDAVEQVMRLLEHHDDDDGHLASPILENGSFAQISADIASADEQLPTAIGMYKIIRRLGTGGMGAVYLAEQENPRREVAVKVIRPGLLSRELLKRFELEAAMLGRLQHSGIAQIHEAGMFDDGSGGQPFFAMEYIEGPPLLDYANEQDLSTGARLELFARICDAVQHAHQRGVIHRDLKPGNILVEANGQPKILDFGVARATDSDIQVTTIQTNAAQLIGTLPYMSPEQVIGRAHDIDVRADVYALGVILYELLAGRLPYEMEDVTVVTAASIIADVEPTPLSAVNRVYRGDLNTIVLKALEKDPERRYASASDLAADIRRYLDNQPIVARPATTMYQLRKFARRNRGLVAGFIVAFVILISGVVVTTVFAIGQTQALNESERQRKVSEAVNSFLNDDLLAKANPYTGEAHDVLLREVVDAASERIESRFLDEPLVHAAIRATLGTTYLQLGEYDKAEMHVKQAMAIYESEEGAASVAANKLRNTLVSVYLQDSKLEEAEALIEKQLILLPREFGAVHPFVANAHANRAVLDRKLGRNEEAVSSYRTALEIFARCPDAKPRDVQITKYNLALAFVHAEQYDEAERLYQEVLDTRRRMYGPRSADVAHTLNNLGDLYWRQERYPEARTVFELAYDIRLERLGETHLETVRSLYAIGLIQKAEDDFAASEKTHRRVLELRELLLDPLHFDYMASLRAVGNTLLPQGRAVEAAPLFHRAWTLAVQKYGPVHRTSRNWRSGAVTVAKQAEQPALVRQIYEFHFKAAADWVNSHQATAAELNLYAWDLLTCEIEDLRDPQRGLQIAEQAALESGNGDPDILDTLARALAENGRFEDAIETQQRAIDLLPEDESQDAGRESYRQTIAEYRERATQGDGRP